MKNSRRIGAVFEREVAAALCEVLGLKCERGARNGVKSGEDVLGWPGVHVECKRRKSAVWPWLKQSIGDAKVRGNGDVPIVVHRGPREEMMMTLRVADLPRLSEAIESPLVNSIGSDRTRILEHQERRLNQGA